jgi:hypothetical protein
LQNSGAAGGGAVVTHVPGLRGWEFCTICHFFARFSTFTKIPQVPSFRYLPADMLIEQQKTEVRKVSEQYSGKYDVALKSQYPQGSCFGCRFFGKLQNLIHFDTVLDGGAGNGMGVRMMRSLGKAAYGR